MMQSSKNGNCGQFNSVPTYSSKPRAKINNQDDPIILDSDDEDAVLGEQAKIILKYPQSSRHPVTIVQSDLDRLDKKGFLNDSLVDFYLKYLMEEVLPKRTSEKTFVFSSYFYSKLVQNAGKGIEKWSRGVDIFSKDYLIIPINQDLHWSLIIVLHPGKDVDVTLDNKRKAEPSEQEPPKKRIKLVRNKAARVKPANKIKRLGDSKILHFDSLRRTHESKPLYKNIRNYLKEEWKRVKKKAPTRQFSVTVIPGVLVGVPQQKNSYDCGMFLLHFAETYLKKPFNDVGDSAGRDHLFTQEDIFRKRKEIERIIKDKGKQSE